MKQLVWLILYTRISEFYMEESCGQCTPCREGTGWLVRLLHRIEAWPR